jgi:hypothetical protein
MKGKLLFWGKPKTSLNDLMDEGIQKGTTSPPTRADVSNWALATMETLPAQIVKKHIEKYTWFPNEINSRTKYNISD